MYHVLYGKEWLGMVVNFSKNPEPPRSVFKEIVLVQMIPGSRYEKYFRRKPEKLKDNDYRGWISNKWLIKIT